MAKKVYTVDVYAHANKFTLRSDIINGDISNKETRKEIQRIFHIANRRLQNIENAGVYSPAAVALLRQLDGYSGFAKLSMANKDFTDIKILYSQAIEFLRKPTSTARGAKQFARNIQKELNINDRRMQQLQEQMLENHDYFDISSDFEEAMAYFERETTNAASELENAAQNSENLAALENAITKDLEENITDILKEGIINSLKKFGL